MSRLLDMVKNFQYSQGGPIIAFQVENEYGSYNKDPKYLPWVKNIYEKTNIVELLYTSGMDHFLETKKILRSYFYIRWRVVSVGIN